MHPDVREIHNNLKIRGSQIASLNRLVIGDDRQVWEPGKWTVSLVPLRRREGDQDHIETPSQDLMILNILAEK